MVLLVSALILAQDLLHHNTMIKLKKKSQEFADAIEDNVRLFCPNITTNARLEFVIELTASIPGQLRGSDYVNDDELSSMLEKFPMLLPFTEDGEMRLDFMPTMQAICHFIQTKLESVKTAKGTHLGAWTAFQMECALQWLIWGSFFRPEDARLAKELGIGFDSLTSRRGIIGLNAATTASNDGEPPPLSVCTSSSLEQERIERIYNLARDGSDEELGEQLVKVLLKDFFGNKKVKYMELKGEGIFGRIVEGKTFEDLAEKISEKYQRFKDPFTFGQATKDIAEEKVRKLLLSGLSVMRLKKFPAFKTTEGGNQKITWDQKSFWLLHDGSRQSSIEFQPSILEAVIEEIEKREITYESNIMIFKYKPMPWIIPCMKKFKKELARQQTVICLVFVTCIILHQSGIFVHFDRLRKLKDSLPESMSQEEMVRRKILSQTHFHNVNTFHLKRLHESIPSDMPRFSSTNKQPKKVEEDEQLPDRDTLPLEEFQVIAQTVIVDSKGKRWTEVELGLLALSSSGGGSVTEKYEKFKKECVNRQMPVRSFNAFRSRLNRLEDQVAKG